MRLQEIHTLAESGLKLWAITKDPTTFSAAVILLKYHTPKLTSPTIEAARTLLVKQLAAYSVIFPEPL
jgi:hypothetical protein